MELYLRKHGKRKNGYSGACWGHRYAFMLKETHVQAWMVVDALINGYERTQRGCREELLAFLFQLSYCKVRVLYCVVFRCLFVC